VDNLTDISNLSALGALITLVVWFVTVGLPRLLKKASEREAIAREEYRQLSHESQTTFKEGLVSVLEECKAQRIDFRDALSEHKNQSVMLAKEGHEAVNNLASEVRAFRSEIHHP